MKLNRLDACEKRKVVCCVGCRHPATIRKVSLMAGSMRQVWALWYQAGAHYSAGLGCLFTMLLLQHTCQSQQAASRMWHIMSVFCKVTQYVSDLSSVTPRCLGSEQKGRISLCKLTFSSHLASLLLKWKAANTGFVGAELCCQVWRHSPMVPFPCPYSVPLPLPHHLPVSISMHIFGDGVRQVTLASW